MSSSTFGMGGPPPTPIVGMVVVGALLILIEGILEIGVLNQVAVYGLVVPLSTWAVPVFTILLAGLMFFLVWMYWAQPSWGLGVLFIVFGILSFVLGAGFVVGGILIIIAGALACFADWVAELAGRVVRSVRSPASTSSTDARSTEPRSTPSVGVPPKPPSAESAAIVVYHHCSACGELNPRGVTVCSSCGQAIDPREFRDIPTEPS